MKNKFYLKEFEWFDGEDFIKFNIVELKENSITVAVTNRGRISLLDYELLEDENGKYFEFGNTYAHININDFEEGA